MNPGKKVDAPSMTENLRYGPTIRPVELKTHLDFSREGGFMAAVEMCNGAAVCRKLKAGTMCPSYMATKDEKDTTRARANALRNALAGDMFDQPTSRRKRPTRSWISVSPARRARPSAHPASTWRRSRRSFWRTTTTCMARPPRQVFGHIHTLSKLGSPFAPLANSALTHAAGRAGDASGGGRIPSASCRPSSATTSSTLEEACARAAAEPADTRRSRLLPRHLHHLQLPAHRMAAVKLLEAAGFEVIIEERRACCGRPMLSKGLVEEARKSARRNVELLAPYARAGIPIIGIRAELHPDLAR